MKDHVSRLHGFNGVLAAAFMACAISSGRTAEVVRTDPVPRPKDAGDDARRIARDEQRARLRELAQANARATPTRQQRRALERQAAKRTEAIKKADDRRRVV